MNGILDAARFADGMTFEAYVAYIGTPENLAREAGWWLGPERQDLSGIMRDGYARARVTDAQRDAVRWLAAQPNGPANVVVLSEEWSSDCRRDVPMLARLAEAGGLALRVFTRDGRTLGRGPKADPIESPNADLVNAFLNEKGGGTFQSVPVAAFFTRGFDYLAHYTEYPTIYHKDRLAKAMQARRPGESEARAWPRFIADWGAMQQTPFFMLWAGAAVDEILSALYEKVIA